MTNESGQPVPFVSAAFKAGLFSLPAAVVAQYSKSHTAIAIAWVAGALLQTMIPPAKAFFFRILMVALAAAAIQLIFKR